MIISIKLDNSREAAVEAIEKLEELGYVNDKDWNDEFFIYSAYDNLHISIYPKADNLVSLLNHKPVSTNFYSSLNSFLNETIHSN